MPPPPPPTPSDAYANLIAALHPSPPTVLEIEILPSAFPPQILHDPPALAVPKSLLTPLYLHARRTLSDHIASPDPASHPAALHATLVIHLFDPTHLTAANFRKRHLQRLRGEQQSETGPGDQDAGTVAGAVWRELTVLESLVTSPLSGKHAKSSTLWAQRLWVVENFWRSGVREGAIDETVGMTDGRRGVRGFWEGELVIVMKAGERHPRNYYAWQYARQLLSFVRSGRSGLVGKRCWERELVRDSIRLVHGWCLMHPRDISGWAFSVFLLEQLRDEGCDEGDKRKEFKDDVGILASETKEFARKYRWEGESIQWFLKAMAALGIDD